MRPNAAMIARCQAALARYGDDPASRLHCEEWMVRFARTSSGDKVLATIRRVAEWFAEHEGFRDAARFHSDDDPGPERVAWDMLGGDPGRAWASSYLGSLPDGEASASVISDTYDRLEAEADAREEALAAAATLAEGRPLVAGDWADAGVMAAFEGRRPEWTGVLGLEGVETSDRRFIHEGGLSWRALPLTLQDQILSQDGHDGALAAGPITNIWRDARPDGGQFIRGEGLFDSGEDGMGTRRRMAEGTKMGVSMDLTEVQLDLPEDPDALMEILMGEARLEILTAVIAGATMVTIPAFAEARLQIVGDLGSVEPAALVAAGGRLDGVTLRVVTPIEFTNLVAHFDQATGDLSELTVAWDAFDAPVVEIEQPTPCGSFSAGQDGVCGACGHTADSHPVPVGDAVSVVDMGSWGYTTEHAVVAAAGGGLPLSHTPPAWWLEQQSYAALVPWTIEAADEHGRLRLHGHVAAFGSAHTGRADVRIDVPRGLDYDSFQGPRVEGEVLCDDGTLVRCGPVIIDNVHPSLKAKASDAYAHYHFTGSMVAQVRCYEDRWGLQVQGWVLPTVTADDLVKLRAASISPDWRPRATARGGQGVIALLGVPVTGFNLGLVAAGPPPVGEEQPPTGDDLDEVALAVRKVHVLARLGRPAPEELAVVARSGEPAEVTARKADLRARLHLV